MIKRFTALVVASFVALIVPVSLVSRVSAQVGPISGGGGVINATTISGGLTCTDAVGTDAYACSATTCPAALADKQVVVFEAGTLNTAGATFAFCGFTAKALMRYVGGVSTALVTGDILAKQPVAVYYHLADDNWKMFSEQASAGLVNTANSWSADQTYPSNSELIFGTTSIAEIGASTIDTPDSARIYTGTTPNSIKVTEIADIGFDFNNGRCLTSACTNPSVIIHSPDQVITEYLQLSTDATGAAGVQSNLGEIRLGGAKTAITEGSAQAIVRVAIPTSTNIYGATIFYSIYDINGSNYVVRSGQVRVQGGNASGTATCTINAAQDTEAEDGSQIATSNAYTLTYTWTNVVATTNCDLSLNAASSAGANTFAITWTAVVTGNANTVTASAQ